MEVPVIIIPSGHKRLLSARTEQRFLYYEGLKKITCCAGGGDFYMAAKFGVFVHGVDLSVNMVTTALERTVASINGQKVREANRVLVI
jgi:ubiquinone/menaquinone biosynthesis C-methylase UbiE